MSENVPSDPADLGLLEAASGLRARSLSAGELLEACFSRLSERNGGSATMGGAADAVNAWTHTYPGDRARGGRGGRSPDRAGGGERLPLCGIPIGLKDLFPVAGLPLTASSHVLEGNVAESDCPAWSGLRDQGMVLVGHTHAHEFAAGETAM